MDEPDQLHPQERAVIAYQVGELKAIVERGFHRLEERIDKIDQRTAALEQWREAAKAAEIARRDAEDRLQATNTTDTQNAVLKLAIVALTLALAVVGLVSQGIIG